MASWSGHLVHARVPGHLRRLIFFSCDPDTWRVCESRGPRGPKRDGLHGDRLQPVSQCHRLQAVVGDVPRHSQPASAGLPGII